MKSGKMLISIVIVSLLVSMTIPMASAPPNHPCEPWPECKGGTDPPTEADPAIAYLGSGGIYVMNVDGSHKTNVYPYADYLNHPFWSPDGTSIVFQRGGTGGGGPDYEIWAIDVQVVDGEPVGSNARMLADSNACGGAACRGPVWSPAGDEIAVEGIWFYGNPGVYLFPASGLPVGGKAEKIYSGVDRDGAGQVAWKSDASQIAFWFVDREGEVKVDSWMVILDLTQSPPVVLTTLLQGQFWYFQGVDWARTHNELLFSAKPTGGDVQTIYRMDISTGVPIEVVAGINPYGGPIRPAWSPDDNQMVYSNAVYNKGGKWRGTDIVVYEFGVGDSKIGSGSTPDWKR